MRHADCNDAVKMASTPSIVSSRPTEVLLIEENFRTRDLHAGILRMAGFDVVEVARANAVVQGVAPDIVLADAGEVESIASMLPGRAIIALADDPRQGVHACLGGADDWVPSSSSADYLLDSLRPYTPSRT